MEGQYLRFHRNNRKNWFIRNTNPQQNGSNIFIRRESYNRSRKALEKLDKMGVRRSFAIFINRYQVTPSLEATTMSSILRE